MPRLSSRVNEGPKASIMSSLPSDMLLLVLSSVFHSCGYSSLCSVALVCASFAEHVRAFLATLVGSISTELGVTLDQVRAYRLTLCDKSMLQRFNLKGALVEVQRSYYRSSTTGAKLCCETWHGVTFDWNDLSLRYQVFIRPCCEAYKFVKKPLGSMPYVLCDETRTMNASDRVRFVRSHDNNKSAKFTRIRTQLDATRSLSPRSVFPFTSSSIAMRRCQIRGQAGIEVCLLHLDNQKCNLCFPLQKEYVSSLYIRDTPPLISSTSVGFRRLKSISLHPNWKYSDGLSSDELRTVKLDSTACMNILDL